MQKAVYTGLVTARRSIDDQILALKNLAAYVRGLDPVLNKSMNNMIMADAGSSDPATNNYAL